MQTCQAACIPRRLRSGAARPAPSTPGGNQYNRGSHRRLVCVGKHVLCGPKARRQPRVCRRYAPTSRVRGACGACGALGEHATALRGAHREPTAEPNEHDRHHRQRDIERAHCGDVWEWPVSRCPAVRSVAATVPAGTLGEDERRRALPPTDGTTATLSGGDSLPSDGHVGGFRPTYRTPRHNRPVARQARVAPVVPHRPSQYATMTPGTPHSSGSLARAFVRSAARSDAPACLLCDPHARRRVFACGDPTGGEDDAWPGLC